MPKRWIVRDGVRCVIGEGKNGMLQLDFYRDTNFHARTLKIKIPTGNSYRNSYTAHSLHGKFFKNLTYYFLQETLFLLEHKVLKY